MASFPPRLHISSTLIIFVFTSLAISEFFLSLSIMDLKDRMSEEEEGKVASYVGGGVDIL